MDTLGLQAALIKLDPSTTVTPIGTSVKILPRHHHATYVDVDENDVTTIQNKSPKQQLDTTTRNKTLVRDSSTSPGIVIASSQQPSQQQINNVTSEVR
uniref:Uncharacterized protein n=1 Tax=Bracon brevicornis TaxID=1563983 RepID=A0A6V7KNT6_9HYME